MRETKKIERLGFTFATSRSSLGSEAAEFDQTCLLRM